jgi:hypothetical protein
MRRLAAFAAVVIATIALIVVASGIILANADPEPHLQTICEYDWTFDPDAYADAIVIARVRHAWGPERRIGVVGVERYFKGGPGPAVLAVDGGGKANAVSLWWLRVGRCCSIFTQTMVG